MKKIITTVATIVMVLSMGTMTAFAGTPIESVGGASSAEVKGSYKAGTKADTVYSVDVQWGSMEFTYTGASQGTWNPEDHTYTGKTEAAWTNATNANKITVTNHSNAAVKATLKYDKDANFDGITGVFTEANGTADDGIMDIESAVGTETTAAPTASATLGLSGELASNTTSNTKIGNVTVTITEVSGTTGSDFVDGGKFGR